MTIGAADAAGLEQPTEPMASGKASSAKAEKRREKVEEVMGGQSLGIKGEAGNIQPCMYVGKSLYSHHGPPYQRSF